MSRFRKKPVVIRAVQLNWRNWTEICEFLGGIINPDNPAEYGDFSDTCNEIGPYINIKIPTLEGIHTAKHGDWIIQGVLGEFYPCKPDIFEQTYEAVEEVTQ